MKKKNGRVNDEKLQVQDWAIPDIERHIYKRFADCDYDEFKNAVFREVTDTNTIAGIVAQLKSISSQENGQRHFSIVGFACGSCVKVT